MTAPRRRWSFSLRTLFAVVTVIGVCGGYIAREWRIVANRSKMLDWLGNPPDDQILSRMYEAGTSEADFLKVPWLRRALGDVRVKGVLLPHNTDARAFERFHELFPEALFSRCPPEDSAATQDFYDEWPAATH